MKIGQEKKTSGVQDIPSAPCGCGLIMALVCALTIKRQQKTTSSWVKTILSGLFLMRECLAVEIHDCNTVSLTTKSSLNPSSD